MKQSTNQEESHSKSDLPTNDIQSKIDIEQVKILHHNFLPSIFASFVCSIIVFTALLNSTSAFGGKIWFAAMILASIIRLSFIPLFRFYPQHIKFHLYLFIVGTSTAAILWGVAGSVLIPPKDLIAQMLIISLLAGVSAGGVQTLNAHLTASLLFLIFSIGPLCVWLIMQKGNEYVLLSIGMVLYLIFMIVSSYRNNRQFSQWQYFYFENKNLLSNLTLNNNELTKINNSLKKHENEMAIINEMNQMLQLCKNSSEAYDIIKQTTQKIFIGINGSLAIYNSRTGKLQTVESWNWDSDQNLCDEFEEIDCWALRRDKLYIITNPKNGPICAHFKTPPHGNSICIPLKGQNEIIGMINFNASTDTTIDTYQRQIMTNFGDVIKLSLANIKLHEALKEQATHDPLTGLFNRRHLDEFLQREITRVTRSSGKLCLAMLDIDHFKKFNDENGHDAGDLVLKFIAEQLKSSLRESDIICRYGGEEIVIVLLDTEMVGALARLNSFRNKIKSKQLHFEEKVLPSISVSMGISEAPMQTTIADELIRLADEALYKAKHSGRDKIIVAEI